MNAKFHYDCENTGKILKISYASCYFVKFDIYFSGPHEKFSFVLLQMLVTSIALEKCKKRMQCALNYSGTRISSIENQNYSVS